MMIMFCYVAMVAVLAGPSLAAVIFPEVRYVEPGTDFEMLCRTDTGIISRIYSPTENVPSDADLQVEAAGLEPNAFTADTSTKIHAFEDASEAKHGGQYTCVAFYDTGAARVETAVCLVVVVDLCGIVECPLMETCIPDYTTGTHLCRCDQQCSYEANFLCSDTCEFFFHECSMEETMCADKIERSIMTMGFCPAFTPPVVAVTGAVQEIVKEAGEIIMFDAGLLEDGVPAASIQWWVDDQEMAHVRNRQRFMFQVPKRWHGFVESRVIHCKDQGNAQTNRYDVTFTEETEEPPTATQGYDNLVVNNSVCSIYPTGVLTHFDGTAALFDLACTHVLAADVMAGPAHDRAYYIYGTFDQHDGATALVGVTVFVDSTGFEVQRGWLINQGGSKMRINEGVESEVPGSGCKVLYQHLHIAVTCEGLFSVYYDGVMAAHVVLAGSVDKGHGSFGLCWDSAGGFRTNWKLQFTPECTIQADLAQCGNPGSCDSHTNECSAGPNEACAELTCDGAVPTPAQRCALSMAGQVSCALQTEVAVPDLAGTEGCPQDECEWKRDVLGRGCPQEYPPFSCGETDQTDA